MSEIPVPFSLIVMEEMEHQRIKAISYPIGQTGRKVRAGTAVWSQATILVLLGAVIVAALCLIYLRQGTMILDLTASRKETLIALTAVEEVNRELEFKIGQAFSLARVSRIARNVLRMLEPTVIHYVHINLQPSRRD